MDRPDQVEVAPCLPDPGTSGVPFRMADGVHIPAPRYYDRDFAELEKDKLWRHAWQFAARAEDVPDPGDYVVYRVADQTVMVVRVDEETIKVFHNVCPHRATELVQDCGTFGGGKIVCPFHGWRWKTDGSLSYVYADYGFVAGSIDPAKLALKEVRSECRHGFVWITFDDEAPSLGEFLGEADRHLAPKRMDLMRLRWWKYAVLPANWKVALEAFMEAYHVMQAHPELSMGATGDDYDPEVGGFTSFPYGHTFTLPTQGGALPAAPVRGMALGDFYLAQLRIMFEGTDAYTTIREDLIADRVRGQDLSDEEIIGTFFREFYAYAQDAGIPLPPPSPEACGYGYLFPNMVFLGMPGNELFYRVRPNGDDPNTSVFEVFAMQIPPAGEEPPPVRPEGPLETEDWPFILRQDFENVTRQQTGYRSGAFAQATMSPHFEPMIFHMHNEIDRYLAR